MTMLVTKHERCTCGHCRCEHAGGFQGCTRDAACMRYTWPGKGADLPADHALGKAKPAKKTRIGAR